MTQCDRAALLRRGRNVLARHRQKRESLASHGTPRTPVPLVGDAAPSARLRASDAAGTADNLLLQALSSPSSDNSSRQDAGYENQLGDLVDMTDGLHALFESGRHSETVLEEAARLTPGLVKAVHAVVAQCLRTRQLLDDAERAAQERAAATARGERKLELFRKQLAMQAEAACHSASSEEVARIKAERDELRRSLSSAVEHAVHEKEVAEKRAALAEAAMRGVSDQTSAVGLAPPNTPAGQAQEAMLLDRWSSFIGEDAAAEAAQVALRNAAELDATSPEPSTGKKSQAVALQARVGPDEQAVTPLSEGCATDDQLPGRDDAWPVKEMLTPSPRQKCVLPLSQADATSPAHAPPSDHACILQMYADGETRVNMAEAGELTVYDVVKPTTTHVERAMDELTAASKQMQAEDRRAEKDDQEDRDEDHCEVENDQETMGKAATEEAQVYAEGKEQSVSMAVGTTNAETTHASQAAVRWTDPVSKSNQDDDALQEDSTLLARQIAAIMMQHAEDSKRMLPSDAGRFAMQAMQHLREQFKPTGHAQTEDDNASDNTVDN